MDIRAVLSRFDDQVRRDVKPGPGERVEGHGQVVRIVDSADGWNGVVWSDLADDEADTAIGDCVLVAEIADLAPQKSPTAGVELFPVVDSAGVEALVQVHDQVFGGDS